MDAGVEKQVAMKQPLPIYLEAGARLARDDESGLALLEHVIVLDPDA